MKILVEIIYINFLFLEPGLHFGLFRQVHSWANDATYALIGDNMTNAIVAKVSTPKPEVGLNETRTSEIQVYLDPKCRYAISIRSHLGQMFGQIVRFYYPMLLPCMTSVVIMLITHQLKILDREGHIPACHKILWSQVSPISSVMPARLLSSLLSSAYFVAYFPETDFVKFFNRVS